MRWTSLGWMLLICGFAVVKSSAACAQPAQVIIIRHAEKPAVGSELSLAGRERAAALAPYFMGTKEVLEFGPPAAIYAQNPKNGTSSVRAMQTVQPLAAALHETVRHPFEREDHAKMVSEIMHSHDFDGKMVLVSWEHKVIPDIAKEFGVEDGPDKFSDSVFDEDWIITFHGDQKPTLKIVPQRLMFGDAETVGGRR